MTSKVSRRQFVAGGVAGAAGLLALPSSRAAFGYRAHERLNLAVVGMAGYGAWHGFAELIHTYDNVAYAASCDVDGRKVRKVYDLWAQRARDWPASDKAEERAAAREHYGPLSEHRPPLYADFRRMLDKAAGRIDAVVVATPDHTHAVIAAAALRAGKPVLAEKPLAISAHEARGLHRLAREHKLPTQMNNGGTASPGFRRGVEILREGVIGPVREVHVFFSRGGRDFHHPPRGVHAVPKELDWDLWLAQVAWRDYHPGGVNRIGWRGTSLGELGNFGPHAANMAFMALNVKDLWDAGRPSEPIRVVAQCSGVNELSYPTWETVRWEVPARGDLPPVTIHWHHGPPPDCAPGSRGVLDELLRDHGATEEETKAVLQVGCVIVGAKGALVTDSHNTKVGLLPRGRFEDVEQRAPKTIPSSPGHYREWVDACRGGPTAPMSNFEYAAPFAEFLCVGSLATRFPDEVIEFDPGTGRITNHPKAAGFLRYEYREGWTI